MIELEIMIPLVIVLIFSSLANLVKNLFSKRLA